MSAETLRRAAALMRERAEAATPGPWGSGDDAAFWGGVIADGHNLVNGCCDEDGWFDRTQDAEHVASWHPAVALAVADWLDDEANTADETAASDGMRTYVYVGPALAVARAYLGESA